ncbi:MAG: hypothetical protein M3O32_00445 [Actinomycetota bacterium]|nr:hypothetical protein [Actinomycetota bacterium]
MIGLRFHEVMEGLLGPQFIDADDGFGYKGAVAAKLSARIDIRDVKLFVSADLPHAGILSVELRVPILSSNPFVANDGKFELFRPGELGPGGRGYVMVYDARVTDGHRVYQMTGRKYLHPTRLWRVWRLWRETTTLYVTLVAVLSADADHVIRTPELLLRSWVTPVPFESEADRDFHRPRQAAGIVHISAWEFIMQLVGMRGVGASWFAETRVRLRFMAFFAASLFRIYVLGRHVPPD